MGGVQIQRYEEEAKKRDEEAMSLSMAVNHAEQARPRSHPRAGLDTTWLG